MQIRSCFYTSDEMSQEFYSTFGNAVVNHLPQISVQFLGLKSPVFQICQELSFCIL